MADNDRYVTNASWLRAAGRVDLIDEVADQFERPVESPWPDGRSDFWARNHPRWPRRTGALRSSGRLHPHARSVERAGS